VTLNDRKEAFSRAYVQAIAAVAGFATYQPSVDDDSVDLGIAARGGGGSTRSPRLELQLKCTARSLPNDDTFGFHLKLKNYNDLRTVDLLVPRVLVVVIVPEDPMEWLKQSEHTLALQRCGYWLSLRGLPDTGNNDSVTVRLPRANVFSKDALCAMMQGIGMGATP
jgi:hypothetical protein